MNMREIRASVHRDRSADVLHALKIAGFHGFKVLDLGVGTEVQIEFECEDESRTAEAVHLIQQHAKTGQPCAGWIKVSDPLASIEITA